MRANKIISYHSILQVLPESGCPFCRFMNNSQAALLQDPVTRRVKHLCNFHAWGLAARPGRFDRRRTFPGIASRTL